MKYHFVHPKIDAKMVVDVFVEEVVPWALENGIKMFIMDNDAKFHTKSLVTKMAEYVI